MKLLKNPIFWMVILVGVLIVIGYRVMVETSEQQEAIWRKEKEKVFTLHEYDLYGIAIVPPSTLWAVGSSGMLLQSSDSGKTWQERQIGAYEQLYSSVCFPDREHGWIVGIGSMILYTEDGGKNWEQVKREGNIYYKQVFFLDVEHGWIVGEEGTLLRTTDGGKTWESIETNKFLEVFHDVKFFNKDRGWLVGEQGTVMFSSDGGRTWQDQQVLSGDAVSQTEDYHTLKVKPTFMSLAITGENTVWIAGLAGTLFVTRDGGNTWKKNPLTHGTGVVKNHIYKIYEHDIGKKRRDFNTMYILGRGAQYFSYNDGLSWRAIAAPEDLEGVIVRGWFHDMVSDPLLKGPAWIVGKWGVILKLSANDWVRVH